MRGASIEVPGESEPDQRRHVGAGEDHREGRSEDIHRNSASLEHEHQWWAVGGKRRRQGARHHPGHPFRAVPGSTKAEIGDQECRGREHRESEHCFQHRLVDPSEEHEAERNAEDRPGQQSTDGRPIGGPPAPGHLKTIGQKTEPGRDDHGVVGRESQRDQRHPEKREPETGCVLGGGGKEDSTAGAEDFEPGHLRTLPFGRSEFGDSPQPTTFDKL